MIVPMKKATVFALRRDRDALLLELQRSSVIMVTENDGSVRDERADEAAVSVSDSAGALAFLKKYSKKPGLLESAPSVSYEEFSGSHEKERSVSERSHAVEEQMAAQKTEISSCENALEQFEPWLALDIPLREVADTRAAAVHTGYIPQNNAAKLMEFEEKGMAIQLLGASAGSLAVFAVCHKSQSEDFLNFAKPLGFIEAAPPAGELTAKGEQDKLKARIAAAKEKLAGLEEEAKKLAEEYTSLELLYDRLNADLARMNTPYSDTDATFYLTGWVEESRAQELEEAIRSATDVYELVLEDPAEGEQAPTLVKNNRFVTPFETLTDMFSRPNPKDGIDPNPVMAPWYWIIFGMMMADAGYGLVMILLIGLFIKLKAPKGESAKLMRVLMYAGLPTIFWGVMFGSYFGAEWFPPVLFTPLYDPIPMMAMSFVVGALHMFCGMFINARQNWKQGDWQEALGNHISWIFLIAGLGLLFLPALKIVSYAFIGIGLVLILAFSKHSSKNPIKRICGGVGSLYGITSYMSDILSYSRILALMLSSAVVGMVMNMLAGMVMNTGSVLSAIITIPFSVLIYLVGHVFNIVMSLLSAYVHASRLQYIEFYGKFYEGGGYAFQPLSLQTKYYNVQNK